MPQPWRDIDDPGVWRKPEPETPTKPATGYDDSPPPLPEPLAKEYRFKDVSIVEPAQGFEKNKPFDMEGEIEPFDNSKPISASKILLYPIGVYNGQEEKFVPGGIEADLDQATGKFRATLQKPVRPPTLCKRHEQTRGCDLETLRSRGRRGSGKAHGKRTTDLSKGITVRGT